MWDFIHRLFGGKQEERPDQVRLGSGVVITTATVVVAAGVSITGIAWALSTAPSYEVSHYRNVFDRCCNFPFGNMAIC